MTHSHSLALIFIILSIINSSGSVEITKKLSTAETVKILKLMDAIESIPYWDTSLRPELEKQFLDLSGINFHNVKNRDIFYKIIDNNNNQQNILSKTLGIMSFRIVLLVCMVIVSIALTWSVLKDLAIFLTNHFGLFIIKYLLRSEVIYTIGLILSAITIYLKLEHLENSYWGYFFVFENATPLFGCFLLYLTMSCICYTHYDEYELYILKDFTVNLVWVAAAIYHHNSIVGVFAVIQTFNTLGFRFGSRKGGYYTGFGNRDPVFRCALISIILNVIMLTNRTHPILSIFETGILFWGTLLGSISIIIMGNEYYWYRSGKFRKFMHFIMQPIALVYYLSLIYLGSIFYISSYKGIGGTFLVLWALDFERTILRGFCKYTTVYLMIILANLYLIKELLARYPEYFIFN